jgi:uncharacterized protein (UPF0332 family)
MTISVNLRLEKARECLASAVQNAELEAYATAANRSYYCIFHAIRAVLITVGFSAKKHSGNISEFQRLYVKTKIFPDTFSDIISRAFYVRNKSDYDDYYVVAKAEVLQQIANARVFLEAVENYIGGL